MASSQPGDIYIMLVEHSNTPRPDWQTQLQSLFHGQCTSSLHITSQRISPTNSVSLSTLVNEIHAVSEMLSRFSVTGERLEVWFSDVRDCHIIKCMASPGEMYNQYIARLNQLFDAKQIRRHYHIERIYTSIPITVLEGIAAETEFEEIHHHIVQQPLFEVENIVISQLTNDYSFHILDRWGILP